MKANYIDFLQISKEKTLRNDCVYQALATRRTQNAHPYYTFKELFDIIEEKTNYEDIVDDFKYCQIGDVSKEGITSPATLNFDVRDLLNENYYKKIEKGDIMPVQENDILLSFLLPQDVNTLGKFIRIRADVSDIYFSTAFIRLKAKVCPEVLFYCLRSIFYKDLVSVARIRKGYTGYATISNDELNDLRFDKGVIDSIQRNYDFLRDTIIDSENKIQNLVGQINTVQEIIDSCFINHFEFDFESFKRLKKIKKHFSSQVTIANNPDLRFSAKFHREAGDYVMSQLTSVTDKKIKHFLSEPIVLGASVSPDDYSEDGEFCYISMATIKGWSFNSEGASTVSKDYSDAKTEKTVRKNDIILARSGEGTIGKVALIDDDDVQGVFADFTMRIRLKNYSPEFAYYYFRTSYFQYLIEVYKKGLGNNTNIFPIVIQEFPLIDISLEEQQRIVEEIHTEIAKQDAIKVEIADLRAQIDKIIENTIRVDV